MTQAPPLLMFSQSDIQKQLHVEDYLNAVEQAHRLHGEGRIIPPDLLHAESAKGEFHVKIGGLLGRRNYFGLKANGGFFGNTSEHGLPNILGIIYLCDADNGLPLAILDSVTISRYRTAAATAVAAKYLARGDSESITICGAGNQAEVQLQAILKVLPLRKVRFFAPESRRLNALVERCREKFRLETTATADLERAVSSSDVLITCTPARRYFVNLDWIPSGMFIAAVGADSPGKQELDPKILAQHKTVVDIRHQCVRVGECQHAIAEGILSEEAIHGELGEVICGKKAGRTDENEITVYDSTGTALQDVAVAAHLYEKCRTNPQAKGFALLD